MPKDSNTNTIIYIYKTKVILKIGLTIEGNKLMSHIIKLWKRRMIKQKQKVKHVNLYPQQLSAIKN